MELFRTSDFYIFVSGEHTLWWDRFTGAFIPKTGWDLADAEDPVCMGICEGIVGKVEHPSVFDARLLLIKESLPVGKLHGDSQVYKIKSVVFLPSGQENNIDLNLQQCPKHKSYSSSSSTNNSGRMFDIQKNTALTKTWGTLKSAGNTIKNTTQQAAAAAMATTAPKRRDFKDKERFEKQIVEEFYKIFTDTNSFYFSRTTDLTNSLQRLCNLEKQSPDFDINNTKALWRTVDDRFFWNKHMLEDLIALDNQLCDPWILPIVQGYIQIEECKVQLPEGFQTDNAKNYEIFTLGILSRRSRFRAGTRYKRRGVDEAGECANYVETEQLISYQSHEVSFVQVRGSVPVYWSQPGYKYRPPPRIDKGEAETTVAFETHFTKEIQKYGPICAINLVDQSGKERVIFDAYSNHVLQYNSPFLTYVTFDFHEYCRGMHFENVSILINALVDVIKDMNYCWRDKQGHICSQNGVFRVNCIDCLDRTNVVQTAIGKAVMEMQFCKLGLISPEGVMPNSIKSIFQLLWANNGDTISRQYAGTNALKGDYTRTGERKFTGIMKDGMNSANRYFISHFRDSVRQCCLDIMHGNDLSDLEIQDFWSSLRILGCIASEMLPDADSPPYTPHLALEQEFQFANLLYHMSRYYLSRFKDSTRQGTIDLMLGNYVSEDIFNESKAHQFEEDNAATAEHVKLLIEDCKKMLINQPELVLGAWGLINADPSTGDPSETEMDSILILTKDSYFVADYDDQVDKVTKYQRVELEHVELLECGMPESGTSLFRTNRNRFCVRINYKVEGVSGYYHMFRSTNLRFFNNMAVIIKNEEEEIESLKAICEAFVVALDICGLPPVRYSLGKNLDKRKSKVLDNQSSGGIYLDIMGLPQMTRNVSESQLLALKNVGSKAISNMTQQFSKLNKIGNTFKKSKLREKANFTIGNANKNESSSDSEDDYENSIFQPNISPGIIDPLQYATDSSSNNSAGKSNISIEQAIEATERDDVKMAESAGKSDHFLPSVGIVMGSKSDNLESNTLEQKLNLLSLGDSSQVDNVQLSSIMQTVSLHNQAPEIQINSEGLLASGTTEGKKHPPNTLKLDKKLSHSSGEVDADNKDTTEMTATSAGGEHQRFDGNKRSNSDYDVTSLNISQSQSESALKSKQVSHQQQQVAANDLVLSPFSKLAKGVQNLGANLDPRKLGGGQVRQVSEKEMEEHRKLQERWQHSKTRLIAL